MNTPTAEEIAWVHVQTREIGANLAADPAFRAQYLAAPVAALSGWGLPLDAASEMATKIAHTGSEVSGYTYDSDGVYYRDMLDDYGIHINWGM